MIVNLSENDDYMIENQKIILKAHTNSTIPWVWKGEKNDLYSNI